MKLPYSCTWWIDPGKILGGRYPGTKNPKVSRQMQDDLLSMGVRTIINLQPADERGRGGSLFPDYRPAVAEFGNAQGVEVACHHFPVSDLGVPTQETMVKIQDTIRQSVDAGKLVYVHCWGGHGRTGTVGGCWLVSRGATAAEAFTIMRERRMHDPHLASESAPQTPEQRRMVETWETLIKTPRAKAVPPASRSDGDHGSLRDRAVGSLVGLAVGDAVGTTLEFQSPGTFDPLVDLVGGGPFHLKAGEWTDDTSMALCLAESLVERGLFDPIDQLNRFVRWWKQGHLSVNGRCFDIGNQVTAALNDFLATAKSACGPVGAHNAGNGSLMRLCPVAIAYVRTPAPAIAYAARSSRTTHGNPECVDACRYFAGLLVGAMKGEDKQTLLSPRYTPLPGIWESEPLQPKVAAIADGSFKTRQPPSIKGTGYVVDCLEAALWAFNATDSFEQAILQAANLGDDADTTAAVCGQLAGAFYGRSGIPATWLAKLAQRDMIEGLAASLLTTKFKRTDWFET